MSFSSAACPLDKRADPQSAAEALALTTALVDFTNTRNTRDMNIETVSVKLRDPPHTASSSAESGFFGQHWRTRLSYMFVLPADP